MEPELNINQLISASRTPAHIQFRAYLFFLLDRKGNILKAWENTSFPHPRDIKEAIQKKPTIFKSFDFGAAGDLEELPDTYAVYPDRLGYLKSDALGDFYSRLPLCNISVNRAGDGLFLGAVRLTNYFPNTSYGDDSTIIYTDAEDRLMGFNRRFYDYFKDRFKEPGRLLGRSARGFFSPSPKEVQRAYFASLKTPGDAEFSESFLEGPPLDGRKMEFNPADFTAGEGGLEWASRAAGEYSFLTLLKDLCYATADFLLEMDLEVMSGQLPLMVTGGAQKGGKFPESFDYTVGSTLDAERFFLKKGGFTITCSPELKAPPPRAVRCRLTKLGFSFVLEINRETVLKYHDFDFLSPPSFRVSLGLRPGSRVLLKRLGLKVRPLARPLEKKKTIVRLQAPSPMFFSLNYVYNEGLSSSQSDISSFALFNVTEFQESVNRLENLYHDQKRERDRLSHILGEFREKEGIFPGNNRAILQIKEKTDVVAGANATVLIQGETGTGKEMLAKYIHFRSPFRDGPFVKVDCSTLAPTLIESELFGHEKGAFTGALTRKHGKFEQADNGTLFLDEISNLNLQTQAKILNFLQDFTITRVGGERPLRLNLRIIIASNIPIEEMVRRGEFRADLFFRINMVSIELPPLRERMDDLPMLCDYFLQLFNTQTGKSVRGLTSAAYKRLYAHDWPGNVRELKNVINKAFLFCDSDEIDEGLISLPAGSPPGASRVSSFAPAPRKRPGKRAGLSMTAERMREIAGEHGGNVCRIALSLGVTRQSVYYYLRKFGIGRDQPE